MKNKKNLFVMNLLALQIVFIACHNNTTLDSANESKMKLEFDTTTVLIGTQRWCKYDLDVTHFRNGDKIKDVSGSFIDEYEHQQNQFQWNHDDSAKTTCSWGYGDPNIPGDYEGRLYNWHAVNDSRGLAPRGFHIPSDHEWNTLANFLGGLEVAGKKMKSKDSFQNKISPCTNESGFSAKDVGYCDFKLEFTKPLGICWWSSTEEHVGTAWCYDLHFEKESLGRNGMFKGYGFSVRCIKD